MPDAARPFRFALQAVPTTDRAAWQELARRAEGAGFATLQTADHLGGVDPFSPLLSAADATTTLRVGPLVINNELHHPVLLARQSATIDLLTDGRLELGIGTGYAEDEHRSAAIPIAPPRERVTRLGASLRILKQLWETGAYRAEPGEPYPIDITDLGVTPPQRPHPPLLVGGHGDRVLRLAAREAQIVQFTGLRHGEGGVIRPDGFALATIAERVAWVREAAGQRFADLELSSLVQRTVVTDDPAFVAEELAESLRLSVADTLASPFVLLGPVEALVDKLLAQREQLGISYWTVRELDDFAPVIAQLAGR